MICVIVRKYRDPCHAEETPISSTSRRFDAMRWSISATPIGKPGRVGPMAKALSLSGLASPSPGPFTGPGPAPVGMGTSARRPWWQVSGVSPSSRAAWLRCRRRGDAGEMQCRATPDERTSHPESPLRCDGPRISRRTVGAGWAPHFPQWVEQVFSCSLRHSVRQKLGQNGTTPWVQVASRQQCQGGVPFLLGVLRCTQSRQPFICSIDAMILSRQDFGWVCRLAPGTLPAHQVILLTAEGLVFALSYPSLPSEHATDSQPLSRYRS